MLEEKDKKIAELEAQLRAKCTKKKSKKTSDAEGAATTEAKSSAAATAKPGTDAETIFYILKNYLKDELDKVTEGTERSKMLKFLYGKLGPNPAKSLRTKRIEKSVREAVQKYTVRKDVVISFEDAGSIQLDGQTYNFNMIRNIY